MNNLHHTRRAMGGILLIISLLTALLTAGALLPAPNAQASQTDVTVLDPWQAQVVRPPCVPRVDAVQHHAFPVGQRRTVDDGAHRAFQQRLP